MPTTTFPLDQRFGQVLRARLARGEMGFNDFCRWYDRGQQEVNDVLNGLAPISSLTTFDSLDRCFQTTPGYFRQVYENCLRIMTAELEAEDEEDEVPMPSSSTEPTVTITVDLLKRLSNAALDYHYMNPAGREGWEILTKLGIKEDDE